MSIIMPEGKVVPTLTFNRIHITHAVIEQPLKDTEEDDFFNVTIYYKLYGINRGQKHYSDLQKVQLHNINKTANIQKQKGDSILADALLQLEGSLATILSHKLDIIATVL